MQLNINSIKSNLKQFGFKKLFIEDLGWNSFSTNLNPIAFNGTEYSFDPVAELSGMAIILCKSSNGIIPPAQIRKRIDREITKLFFEHILIFIDPNKSKSVWLWMKRGIGKSAKSREHTYYSYQTGDSLISKLSQIAFSFEEFENGKAVLTEVAQRVKKAFDADKVTKKFYDLFKKQREKFFGFIKGIKETEHAEWYTSVMVSRLMFIYFIQKKSFLNNDVDYLSKKLSEIQKHKKDSYYKEFLMPLFFEGFAKKESERKPKINSLLGKIPYLNGGLFLEHQIEQEYKNQIVIPDKAFEELFAFFNQYNWHLDTRDEKDDKEINPDVLGYVFEKYTNQKEMGAYYTKEDITDYICKNTIIPRLFDMLVSNTFAADALIPFPLTEIEPYIYDAVKTKDYLPTETEREYKERQKRYESIKQDFAEGKICRINDLITYNLDIKKFAQDWIYNNDNPEVLSSFYFNCLKKITILDPTVGSGAFLFAALNILEDLYELCLDKFEEFTSNNHPLLNKERDGVRSELSEIQLHNNREYFIYKTIIVNNLYGVDIMEEATEICKLRLFLKLVAQIDDVNKIEPLPDIDFNIKAGNSLVGFASFEEIKKVFDNPLGLKSDIEILSEELAKEIS
ncbi:MAG: SAM-dependent methyltransferase [Ignavibacteriaceae bacterium]|nr:SAM-dependent methyltransferase [Ignavibacteriaceae bacterium]